MSNSTQGLEFYSLSHEWGHGMPQWPSTTGTVLKADRLHFHAMHGFSVQEFDGIMHRGTHMDAPIHVTENWPYLDEIPLWRFFGTGVAVSIPKGKWGTITAEDLENVTPKIEENDIVMINTGSHHNWGDNDDYYAYSPGSTKESAEWLVKKKVKLVGIDVQSNDHPLATKMVMHGTGPTHRFMMDEYKKETGREAIDDFPDWEPAHKAMLGNGIPGIENVGGELDKVTGKRCTFLIFPWRLTKGDGCSVRIVAIVDPEQKFRIPTGN